MIQIKAFAVNPFREVTYVVSDPTRECVIIDCGVSTPQERERLTDYIDRNGLKPVLALNTHAHIDHIVGVGFVQDKYKIPFALHKDDRMILDEGPLRAFQLGFHPNDVPIPGIDIDLSERTEVKFGETVFEIIPTPGHTPGHVSFYYPEGKTLFTGDTLFRESIGRTDLPGGDYHALMDSILNRLLPLGDEVTFYPGHGDHSTLGHEAQYNPFVTEALNGEVRY